VPVDDGEESRERAAGEEGLPVEPGHGRDAEAEDHAKTETRRATEDVGPASPVAIAASPVASHEQPDGAKEAADEAKVEESVAAAPARASVAHYEDTEPSPPTPRPLVHRHHAIVRVTHWLTAVLLAGMIASGLQIYNAFRHFGIRGEPYLALNPADDYRFPEWARLGGWLAGGINWHFALAWPFVVCGLVYVGFLVGTGEWRSLVFRPRDVPGAWRMQLYYLRLRKEHPPQGKHNALQKAAYTGALGLGVISVLSGFAIYKPVQLAWLTWLFGGFELARWWHFLSVWAFVGFVAVHVLAVLFVDPASLRAIVTGWYRGRFPSHD